MARVPKHQPLQPSVLDRLIEPKSSTGSWGQVLRDVKEGIRRDLEDLLNTRWRCSSWPPNLEELDVSLVNYGIPDFTGVNLGAANNQDRFREILERVIVNYEPRLKDVKVELIRNPDPLDRTLQFRIEALLLAEPSPEPVVFDSALEPLSTSFQVMGGRR